MGFDYLKQRYKEAENASLLGETMVCIQAHNDDFDLSLSGIAREYDKVIIVTVTDGGTGHYLLAMEQGLFEDDGDSRTWTSPNRNKWTHDFHSQNLSKHRLTTMKERYDHFGYVSLGPDTRVPDVITYYASLEIQLEYLRKVSQEIANKLKALNVTDYDLFIHDPDLPEHLDHEFCGILGTFVSRLLPPMRLFYFYVYTVFRLPRYKLALVEEHVNHKRNLFSRIWEIMDLPLQMWYKDPCMADKYFRTELITSATDDKIGDSLIPRYVWIPFFRLLRKLRKRLRLG